MLFSSNPFIVMNEQINDVDIQLTAQWFSDQYGNTRLYSQLPQNLTPIPPTVWLLSTGIAGLGGRRWMRRKISSSVGCLSS